VQVHSEYIDLYLLCAFVSMAVDGAWKNVLISNNGGRLFGSNRIHWIWCKLGWRWM